MDISKKNGLQYFRALYSMETESQLSSIMEHLGLYYFLASAKEDHYPSENIIDFFGIVWDGETAIDTLNFTIFYLGEFPHIQTFIPNFDTMELYRLEDLERGGVDGIFYVKNTARPIPISENGIISLIS